MAGEGAHARGAGAGEGDGLRGGGLVCRSRFGLERFIRLSVWALRIRLPRLGPSDVVKWANMNFSFPRSISSRKKNEKKCHLFFSYTSW
jgi:hypothetical protein